MAPVGSNPLHQEWRLSAAALCRYPSTTGCEPPSRSPPHLLTLSAFRNTLLYGPLSMARAPASKVADKMPQREQTQVRRASEGATRSEGSGFPALVRGGEGKGGSSATDVARLVVDKDVQEGAGRRHGHAWKGVGSKGYTDVHSSDRKSRESKATVMLASSRGEKIMKTRVTLVGKEGKEKKPKRAKDNSAKLELRVGLEMCSKRGDVMGAIALYDSAVREGVKLDLYHYNVLLYLCASAASGVVHPAKSGSSSYSSGGASFKGGNLNSNFSNGDSSSLEASSGSRSGSVSMPTDNASISPMGLSCDGKVSDLQGNLIDGPNGSCETNTSSQLPIRSTSTSGREIEDGQALCLQNTSAAGDVSANKVAGYRNKDEGGIQVTEDMRKYALTKGFEIYRKMCLEEIPLSEAALTSVGRMAMSMSDGDMAFEIVKKLKNMGLTLRLRSYEPALFAYCNSGNIEKAFEVERHMRESGIYPEEPELQALLRVSIDAGRGEKVYYVLQKLRTNVRQVSPATAELIEAWFKSSSASRVGKRMWDQKLIEEAFENGGGGWHGQGWLGKGKWNVVRAHVGASGLCESCGDKLVTVDLDPVETENFARSVASIAGKRERSWSFQRFQKWLDYYGPFEAVIDAANVGFFYQRLCSLTKVNSVVNAIRQKLPSKRWPLVIVHNKHVYGGKANDPTNIKLVEKWKNADAIYTTPTGSNDDWYWLYAAIKYKSLIVTNDEMRDHIFQILGNDIFPKWKERHQVHFRFREGRSPEFLMPPPCSTVIQESKEGHWHIPIAVEREPDKERIWLCVTRGGTLKETSPRVKTKNTCMDPLASRSSQVKPLAPGSGNDRNINARGRIQKILKSLHKDPPANGLKDQTMLFDLETAEKLCGCVIDFQI